MFSKAFKYNKCHTPAGSSRGGQFCGKETSGTPSIGDLLAIPPNDRRPEFKKLSNAQKDSLADARRTVQARVDELTSGQSMGNSGDLTRDLHGFIDKFSSEIPDKTMDLAKEMGSELIADMDAVGSLDSDAKRRLAEDIMRNVIAQDIESQSKTLGDHGFHHIYGDASLAKAIVAVLPGPENTPENRLMIMVAAAYHDSGYLTPTARNSMTSGHPRWGSQHFNEHIAEDLMTTMGKNWVEGTSRLIAGHAETSLDWDGDPLKTAMSVADNLALFHREKMPPMARFVPDNIRVMVDLGRGLIDVNEAKNLMRQNISGADLPPAIKSRFLESVNEVSGYLPKTTVGMVGNELNSVSWKDNALHVRVERNHANKDLSRVLDMGQQQFAKMTKTYGTNADELLSRGQAKFVDSNGIVRMVIDLFDTTKKVDSWIGLIGLARLFKSS